jgi:hypothetical protein
MSTPAGPSKLTPEQGEPRHPPCCFEKRFILRRPLLFFAPQPSELPGGARDARLAALTVLLDLSFHRLTGSVPGEFGRAARRAGGVGAQQHPTHSPPPPRARSLSLLLSLLPSLSPRDTQTVKEELARLTTLAGVDLRPEVGLYKLNPVYP